MNFLFGTIVDVLLHCYRRKSVKGINKNLHFSYFLSCYVALFRVRLCVYWPLLNIINQLAQVDRISVGIVRPRLDYHLGRPKTFKFFLPFCVEPNSAWIFSKINIFVIFNRLRLSGLKATSVEA